MKLNYALKIFALMFLLAMVPLAVEQAPGSGATGTPDHLTLTWAGDPATTMTITWRTDITVTSGFVRYKKASTFLAKSRQAKADAHDFTTDLGPSRLFTATLDKLSSDTAYSYSVGDGEHWGDWHTFSTAANQRAFKFLIFGDSQDVLKGDSPYKAWSRTSQKAYAANPDAKFMVNVGDLVDLGLSGAHWNAWFEAAKGVIDRIPEMPTTGNHDFYGMREMAKPAFWVAQFPLPQNGPEGLKSQVYSYNYGPVHFVVLDSQQEEQKKYGDILKIQQSWLENDLSASKARWKIVFFHKPPYGVMATRKNEAIKEAFCPILENHHVDLVFNAHDHGIARTYPINNGTIMEKPSQGVIYYVSGRSGGKTYQNLAKMAWDAFFYDPQEQANYFVVEVADTKITVKSILQDGTIVDTFSIEKTAEISLQTLNEKQKKAGI
jgi:acid phosphatase type 7